MKRVNLIVKKKSNTGVKVLSAMLVLSASLLIATNKNSITQTIASRTVASEANIASVEKSAPVAETETVAVTETVAAAPVVATSAPAVAATSAANTDELAELEKRFRAQTIVGMESLEREKESKAIRITLNSDVFFKLGTAQIEEESKSAIQQIISILKPLSAMSFIEIEGHTDNSPVVRQKVNYPSNWELSAARAASFIPLFSSNGFFKDQMKVIGFGDSRPMFSNQTAKNISAKNRRIILRVFTQEDEIRI